MHAVQLSLTSCVIMLSAEFSFMYPSRVSWKIEDKITNEYTPYQNVSLNILISFILKENSLVMKNTLFNTNTMCKGFQNSFKSSIAKTMLAVHFTETQCETSIALAQGKRHILSIFVSVITTLCMMGLIFFTAFSLSVVKVFLHHKLLGQCTSRNLFAYGEFKGRKKKHREIHIIHNCPL